MKIDYLFSHNKKIGSHLISWGSSLLTKGLKDYPSHVAILLDDTFVLESVLSSGVRIAPYSQWKLINTELYKIPHTFTNEKCEQLKDLMFEVWNKKYDWLGITYFGYCILKYFLFKISLPTVNKWEQEDKYFCTEFAGRLSGHNYSMITPAMLYIEMLEGKE